MAGLGRRSHYRKHLTDAVLHDLPEPDESKGERIARVIGTRGGNMFDIIVAPSSKNDVFSGANEAGDNAGNGVGVGSTEELSRLAEGPLPSIPRSSDGAEKSSDIEGDSLTLPTLQQTSPLLRTPQLAFLPTKFRKLVWIKRNDFVIVECGEEEESQEKGPSNLNQVEAKDGGGGFRYVISHILYKDQVRHIKSKGLWPCDPFFADEETQPSSSRGNYYTSYVPPDKKDGLDDEVKEEGGDDHRYDDDAEGNQYENGAYEENGIVYDDPLADEFLVNTNRIAAMRVDDSSSEEESDGD